MCAAPSKLAWLLILLVRRNRAETGVPHSLFTGPTPNTSLLSSTLPRPLLLNAPASFLVPQDCPIPGLLQISTALSPSGFLSERVLLVQAEIKVSLKAASPPEAASPVPLLAHSLAWPDKGLEPSTCHFLCVESIFTKVYLADIAEVLISSASIILMNAHNAQGVRER